MPEAWQADAIFEEVVEDPWAFVTKVGVYFRDICVVVDVKAKNAKPRHWKKQVKRVAGYFLAQDLPCRIE